MNNLVHSFGMACNFSHGLMGKGKGNPAVAGGHNVIHMTYWISKAGLPECFFEYTFAGPKAVLPGLNKRRESYSLFCLRFQHNTLCCCRSDVDSGNNHSVSSP